MSERADYWLSIDFTDLQRAIEEFTTALPGWWFTIGTCNISRDASCGPDFKGQDAALLRFEQFDSGFHHDDRNGSLADALREVTRQALTAKAAIREGKDANG